MPIVFASGETLGRLRFDSLVARLPDHVLYRAYDEAKHRPVLIRQYVPADPERAMDALPAGGRHARSRWDSVLEQQNQRFDLIRRLLPRPGPAHVGFLESLTDETFFAVLTHAAADKLTTGFAEIRSPSEDQLQQLLLPILDVLAGLHKFNVIYGGLIPEEILLDPPDRRRPRDAGACGLRQRLSLGRHGHPPATARYKSSMGAGIL